MVAHWQLVLQLTDIRVLASNFKVSEFCGVSSTLTTSDQTQSTMAEEEAPIPNTKVTAFRMPDRLTLGSNAVKNWKLLSKGGRTTL